MKNLIARLHVVAFLLLTAGCQQGPEPAALEDLETQLQGAPEIGTLENIRTEVLDRLVAGHVTREQFEAAYRSGDAEQARALLGLSQEELDNLNERLTTTVASLQRQYPDLNSLNRTDLKRCNAGGIDVFISNFDEAMEHYSGEKAQFSSSKDVQCKYGQYTVCLALAGVGAAATGPFAPLTYGGGAYLCLCSYCEGGWVDSACF